MKSRNSVLNLSNNGQRNSHLLCDVKAKEKS